MEDEKDDIEIKLGEEIIDLIPYKKEMKIQELRNEIKDKQLITGDFIFLRNNAPFNKNLETKFNIEKIMANNEIKLKLLEENNSPPPISYNKPINGSSIINENANEKMKFYQYPTNITFTDEEEDKSKVVLLVGKTGDGKSTFINALVNIYLGIQLEDNFRYILINEKNKNDIESNTKDITIYKIRPKEGLDFPPLKIIDTPGFGDTKGIEEDMKHIEKFQSIFENILVDINCICFIIKSTTCREDSYQKYVFNCIINLFAENVKDNFMVGVTNFKQLSDDEKPNCIENSLSVEKSFYYQNILKNDKMSREEIINSDWYFACDNKIIISYMDNNQISRQFWEKTNKNIKLFINKVKRLESKKIKESSNVIQRRRDLLEEIKILTIRMDRIIDDKKRIEYNKRQEDELLQDINNQEEIFNDIEKTIKKELEFLEEIKNKNISIEMEIKNNNTFREQKKSNYKLLNNKILKIKKLNNKKEKVTKYKIVENDNYNVICSKCHYNCHEDCKCGLTGVHKYFCRYFSIIGNCKICHCGISFHQRSKIKIEKFVEEIIKKIPLKEKMNKELKRMSEMVQKLKEDEEKINIKNEELEKQKNDKITQIKKMDDNQKEKTEYLKRIENVIKNLKEEKDIVVKKINECIKEINNIECDVLKILNEIKADLDYLRKNSINKEYNKTMESYIEERIQTTEDYEKKSSLEKLKLIYTQLIHIENIDITQLTCEKFIELRKKIESKSNLVYY